MATVQEKIELMNAKKAHILQGGGEKRIEKQHAKGKMTARERLEKLFDEGSFIELDQFVKHRCTNFGQEKKDLQLRALLPVMVLLTAVWYMHLHRTSPLRVVLWVRCMPRKSGRFRIWL